MQYSLQQIAILIHIWSRVFSCNIVKMPVELQPRVQNEEKMTKRDHFRCQIFLFWLVAGTTLALSSKAEVLVLHEDGMCYNEVLKTLSDVGRRYCMTMYTELYAGNMRGDAVLYNQQSRYRIVKNIYYSGYSFFTKSKYPALTLTETEIHPMTYGQGQGYRFQVTSLKSSIYLVCWHISFFDQGHPVSSVITNTFH